MITPSNASAANRAPLGDAIAKRLIGTSMSVDVPSL
jgi:hypothetical protein